MPCPRTAPQLRIVRRSLHALPAALLGLMAFGVAAGQASQAQIAQPPRPSGGTTSEPSTARLPYVITHTGQTGRWDDAGRPVSRGDATWSGQDADHLRNPMSFRDLGDGTVLDEQTGLIWTKEPFEGTYAEAVAAAPACRTAGHTDWRLPTVKELYSLMDFRGGSGFSPMRPYIDTSVFTFHFGRTERGLRPIDAQYWSSTEYVGLTMNGQTTVFGVNFADGRIKGYPRDRHPVEGRMKRFARFVRSTPGVPAYGVNDFHDNLDGTVTDRASGLMWTRADSKEPMDWRAALRFARDDRTAGHDDWRLPTAKELQSIVDYSRAPDAADPARRGPAIDPVFLTTNPESYFWTGTTHFETPGDDLGSQAVYVCFGRSLGRLQPPPGGPGGRPPGGGPPAAAPPSSSPPPPGPPASGLAGPMDWINVHGAGAQRSDPKSGDPTDPRWRSGFGPQGDDVRILNYVRLVRDAR